MQCRPLLYAMYLRTLLFAVQLHVFISFYRCYGFYNRIL